MLARIARFGWIGRGVGYLLVGYVAVRLPLGWVPADADQQGALQVAAGGVPGRVVLAAVAVGFGLFVVWEALRLRSEGLPSAPSTTKLRDLPSGVTDEVDRLTSPIAKILGVGLYSLLALSAAQLALGLQTSGDSGGWSVERLTAWVLVRPLGQVVIGIAALVVALVAARRFGTVLDDAEDGVLDELRPAAIPDHLRPVVTWLGRFGEAARAVAFVLIATFLGLAAWRGSSDDAGGLDTALRNVVNDRWGAWLVGLVGLGLLAYGAFAVVSAPYRRLPDAAGG